MHGLIDSERTARETERAILRAGLALGIDWQDEGTLGTLVREALDRRQGLLRTVPQGRPQRLRLDLCALVLLRRRLEVETGAAADPGGPIWMALSRVLDREIGLRLDG